MQIEKIKSFEDYNNYPSEPGATTDAEMQDYMKNQNDTLMALGKRLWQPGTSYKIGDIIHSPNMTAGWKATCAIQGKSGQVEPGWTAVAGNRVVDGTAFWLMVKEVNIASVDGVEPSEDGKVVTPLMQGATSSQAGKPGNLPAPDIGMQDYIFTGNGNYKKATDLPDVQAELIKKVDAKNSIIKTYGTVEQLGLTTSEVTWEDIFNALPKWSVLMQTIKVQDFPKLELPPLIPSTSNKYYYIKCEKSSTWSMQITLEDIGYIGRTSVFKNFFNQRLYDWAEATKREKYSMPSSKSISISTAIESYTAPSDGWLFVEYHRLLTGVFGSIYIQIGDRKFFDQEAVAAHNNQNEISFFYLPLAKGQTAVFSSSGEYVNRTKVRFDYAECEV